MHTKKPFLITLLSLLVIFALSMAWVRKQADYSSSEYMKYKDSYINCVDKGNAKSPDSKIYNAWKHGVSANCLVQGAN
ncbi:MAG: hypothetical protein ABI602_00140 [Candidatus Saccharibacteria bacterium]